MLLPQFLHLKLMAVQIIAGPEMKGLARQRQKESIKFQKLSKSFVRWFFLCSRRLAAVTCDGKCSVHQPGLGICRLIFVLSITLDSWKNNLSVLGWSLT